MKSSLGLFIASICLIFGLSAAASAQTKTPGVSKRQKNQQKRIFHGVHNGTINGREYRVLQKQQVKTVRAKRRAKSDGVVTPKERFKLHRRLNKNSRSIYRAKHNGRRPRL